MSKIDHGTWLRTGNCDLYIAIQLIFGKQPFKIPEIEICNVSVSWYSTFGYHTISHFTIASVLIHHVANTPHSLKRAEWCATSCETLPQGLNTKTHHLPQISHKHLIYPGKTNINKSWNKSCMNILFLWVLVDRGFQALLLWVEMVPWYSLPIHLQPMF